MAYFSYHALDKTGIEKIGTVQASSKTSAIKKIKHMQLYPTKVFQVDHVPTGQNETFSETTRGKILFFRTKVKTKNIVIFIRDLSVLVTAGMPLIRALDIMQKQTLSPQLQKIIVSVQSDVKNGQSLSEGFKRFPRTFPDLYINMIKAGEMGGGTLLAQVLKRLAALCENSERLTTRIKSALTYPLLVLIFAFLVVVGLVTFILPKFFTIYDDLDIKLPRITQCLFQITSFFQHHWYILIILASIGMAGLSIIKKNAKLHLLWDTYKLKIPVFGPIFLETALSRFARTFGTLLNSDVPILQAMDIVKEATGNMHMSDAIESTKNSIREGESIAAPLATFPIFPPLVTNMLALGEETGTVGDTLIAIAEKYDEEIETVLQQLTALLEPFLILSLSVVVGFIIIALFMPLISLTQSLSSS